MTPGLVSPCDPRHEPTSQPRPPVTSVGGDNRFGRTPVDTRVGPFGPQVGEFRGTRLLRDFGTVEGPGELTFGDIGYSVISIGKVGPERGTGEPIGVRWGSVSTTER